MKLKEEILISSGEDKEYTCYIEEIGEEEILEMCIRDSMGMGCFVTPHVLCSSISVIRR